MDLKTYKAFSAALYADLDAVLAKHGLRRTDLGATVYPDGTVKMRVTMAEVGADPDATHYTKSAYLYGLKPEWLGRQFVANGKWYEIVGLKNARAKKSVVLHRVADGAKLVCEPKFILTFAARGAFDKAAA